MRTSIYSYWRITDALGHVYTFGHLANCREKTEATYRSVKKYASPTNILFGKEKGWLKSCFGSEWNESEDSKTESYVSTWHLQKIETPSNGKVEFSYLEGSDLSSTSFNKQRNYYCKGYSLYSVSPYWYKESDISTIVKLKTPKYLSKITYNGGELVFKSSSGRLDPGNRKLEKIISRDAAGNETGCISLDYDYFTGPSGVKRLKLKGVNQEGLKGGKVRIAKMQYYEDVNLPNRDSKDFDHWGYYNGKSNDTYFPTSVLTGGISFGIFGASRKPSLSHTRANSLKKIEYSTGGYKEFIYELNRAVDDNSVEKSVGGLRIKSIKEYENERAVPVVTEYEYLLDNGKSSGQYYKNEVHYMRVVAYIGPASLQGYTHYNGTMLKYYSLPYENLFDINGSPVGYTAVREKYTNGACAEYKYLSYSDFDDDDTEWFYFPSEGISLSPWGFGAHGFQKSSRFWHRGLLKETRILDADNNTLKSTVISYEHNAAEKKTVKAYILQPYLVGSSLNKLFYTYKWISQPIYAKTIVTDGDEALYSKQGFVYNENYMLPKKITTENAEGEKLVKEISYPFDYSTYRVVEQNSEAWAIKKMMDRHIHNVPIETIVKKDNNVLSAELNTFKVVQPMPEDNFIVGDKKYKLFTSEPIAPGGFGKYRVYAASTYIDSNYEPILQMDRYNYQGKLIQYHKENDGDVSYVYDSDGVRPIAEVFNARAGLPKCSKTEVLTPIYHNGSQGFVYPISVSHPQIISLFFAEYQYLDSYPHSPYELIVELKDAQGKVVAGDYVEYRKRTAGFNVPKAGVYTLNFTLNRPLAFFAHLKSENITWSYPRNNEIFYTSFEDVSGATRLSTSKTGDFAYKKSYQIDTKNLAVGEYVLSYWKSTNGRNWNRISQTINVSSSTSSYSVGSTAYYIDELSLAPGDARFKTYTYKDGVGLSSETDHNGISTYYEYDEFGRLKRILDNERNVRKEYDYSYAN
jgi:YD repeat-containing protein